MEAEEICAICRDPIGSQFSLLLQGHKQSCDHVFHEECLRPWAERSRSCPLCRTRFERLTVGVHAAANLDQITRDREMASSLQAEFEADDWDAMDVPCHFCGTKDDEAHFILCDRCELGAHTYCDGLSEVPHGDWLCPSCRPTPSVPTSKNALRCRRKRQRACELMGKTEYRAREAAKRKARRARAKEQSGHL